MTLIRPERPGDEDGIRNVLADAFGRPGEAELVDRLRAEGDAAISLVAEEEGEVVGHILFSPVAAPFRALGLGPLAVAPARQQSGIGAALVRAGLERVRAGGWEAVFVLGDPAYYGRFGFSASAAAGFDCVHAGPHLMALALDGELPASGAVAYAPAFAALG